MKLWKANSLSKHLIWFGPKQKSKVSRYMDNTRVLLRDRPNLGFTLNYFSFLL